MTETWNSARKLILLMKAVIFIAVIIYAYMYNCILFKTSLLTPLKPTTNTLGKWGKLVKQYFENRKTHSLTGKVDKSSALFITKRLELEKMFFILPKAELTMNLGDNNKTLNIFYNANTSSNTFITKLVAKENQTKTKEDIYANVSGHILLVLFTTFVDNAEKYVCRNNTLKNWKSFGELVKPVFFTDNYKLAWQVKNQGWDVLCPSKTSIGIPVLKYMFLDVMKNYRATFYAYANGDILFVDNLIDTLQFILNSSSNKTHPMLIVGKRTNVNNVTEKQAATHDSILNIAKRGDLFRPDAEDYFITNPNYPWKDIPDVVVGRTAYDNWLVLNAKRSHHTTIDATNTILAVHQTTKAGNLEGHSHSNANFNANLLHQLYKNINYARGSTMCTSIYTIYNITNSQIQLNNRPGC